MNPQLALWLGAFAAQVAVTIAVVHFADAGPLTAIIAWEASGAVARLVLAAVIPVQIGDET